MNNSQALKIGTFKKIFSNLPTTFNKPIGNIKLSIPLEALLTTKHIFSNKKKAKSQELTKRLVAKRSIKTKILKQNRPSTLFLVAIELI